MKGISQTIFMISCRQIQVNRTQSLPSRNLQPIKEDISLCLGPLWVHRGQQPNPECPVREGFQKVTQDGDVSEEPASQGTRRMIHSEGTAGDRVDAEEVPSV